jgi:hypothetical protein
MSLSDRDEFEMKVAVTRHVVDDRDALLPVLMSHDRTSIEIGAALHGRDCAVDTRETPR